MDFVQGNGMTGAEFLLIWFGFGFASWVLFVVFVGKSIGYKELKKPYMKRAGFLTLTLMTSIGLLCIPILATSAIPFFESFAEPDTKEVAE